MLQKCSHDTELPFALTNGEMWSFGLAKRTEENKLNNTSMKNVFIRDCGSNLYVGMRVVEMF